MSYSLCGTRCVCGVHSRPRSRSVPTPRHLSLSLPFLLPPPLLLHKVIACAKTSDMILMVLDAAKERENDHRTILERELETVGYVVCYGRSSRVCVTPMGVYRGGGGDREVIIRVCLVWDLGGPLYVCGVCYGRTRVWFIVSGCVYNEA